VRQWVWGYRLIFVALAAAITLGLLSARPQRAGSEQEILVEQPERNADVSLAARGQTILRELLSPAKPGPPAPDETLQSPPAPVNLLANPGFEQGLAVAPAGWSTFGDTAWVQDEVFAGERAVRVRSTGGSSGITSAFFEVPEDARVEFTAAIKAHNVIHSGGHYRLRLTVSAYQADRISRIRHWDMVSLSGDTAWREFRGTITAPPGTRYMTLTAQLTNTRGTFWIDQVSAVVVQTIPPVDPALVSQPVIIPAPAHITAGEGRFALADLHIQAPVGDARFLPALQSFLDESGISHSAEEQPAPEGANTLIAGDSSHLELSEHFRQAFPGHTWQDLGQQGYFLSVQPGEGGLQIYLGANSEQGRFYGLQTLKQLVDVERRIPGPVDILDYPSLERRGIMMGLHWYNQREEAVQRMAELKLNFVWNQGAAVNDKFRFRWREPLNDAEKEDLQEYLALAHSHFIDPYISISPKSPNLVNPPIYSSEADIQAVVSKMADLYGLGFRRFGLSFDDLSNYGLERLHGQDVDVWGSDMGQAHLHFIEQVYTRLKQGHPDIHFMVVPMSYSGIINASPASQAYLQTLAGLPAEIEFFTAVEYAEEMVTVENLTGRPHVMMDNFWARFYRVKKPEYVLPLNRPTRMEPGRIAGYAFLPSIPNIEDEALVSWRTAAEYAWGPERYIVEEAFQRAAYQYLRD
jgi:hypothetical protein